MTLRTFLEMDGLGEEVGRGWGGAEALMRPNVCIPPTVAVANVQHHQQLQAQPTGRS